MANVLGKEVADGSHNVIYSEATAGQIPALTVQEVSSGENVRYKMLGAGEVATAIVSIASLTLDDLLYDGLSLLYDGESLLY